PGDLLRAALCIDVHDWPLARYATWSLGDALRSCGLEQDLPLRGLLSMLVEDTVHATVDAAPLINAALGITIRGAGLARPRGGMGGFWRRFVERYRALGGRLQVGTRVADVTERRGGFRVRTSRGEVDAAQVISALPIEIIAGIAPTPVRQQLRPFVERDR